MRISDWSSDVCSSDLLLELCRSLLRVQPLQLHLRALFGQKLRQRVFKLTLRGLIRFAVGLSGLGLRRVSRSGLEHVLQNIGQNLVVGVAAALSLGRAACRDRVCQYV